MKKKIIILICFLILFSKIALSDSLKLKSGKIIYGSIVEEHEDYLKIDTGSFVLTYFRDVIEEIELSKAEASKDNLNKSQKEQRGIVIPSQETAEIKQKVVQKTLIQKEYIDSKDRFRFSKPLSWGVVERNIPVLLKKYQSLAKENVTVFKSNKEGDLSLAMFGTFERKNRKLSYQEYGQIFVQRFGKDNFLKSPGVEFINNERVLSFVVKKKISNEMLSVLTILFFRGKEFYVFECAVRLDEYQSYGNILKELKKSLQINR